MEGRIKKWELVNVDGEFHDFREGENLRGRGKEG